MHFVTSCLMTGRIVCLERSLSPYRISFPIYPLIWCSQSFPVVFSHLSCGCGAKMTELCVISLACYENMANTYVRSPVRGCSRWPQSCGYKNPVQRYWSSSNTSCNSSPIGVLVEFQWSARSWSASRVEWRAWTVVPAATRVTGPLNTGQIRHLHTRHPCSSREALIIFIFSLVLKGMRVLQVPPSARLCACSRLYIFCF